MDVFCKPLAAAGVVDVRIVRDAVGEMDAAVGCPEVAQKTGHSKCGLLEDFPWNALLVRAKTKCSKLFEPYSHRVAHTMGHMSGRGEVDLNPRSLCVNAGSHRVAEDHLR